jgi:hypothetical protein
MVYGQGWLSEAIGCDAVTVSLPWLDADGDGNGSGTGTGDDLRWTRSRGVLSRAVPRIPKEDHSTLLSVPLPVYPCRGSRYHVCLLEYAGL